MSPNTASPPTHLADSARHKEAVKCVEHWLSGAIPDMERHRISGIAGEGADEAVLGGRELRFGRVGRAGHAGSACRHRDAGSLFGVCCREPFSCRTGSVNRLSSFRNTWYASASKVNQHVSACKRTARDICRGTTRKCNMYILHKISQTRFRSRRDRCGSSRVVIRNHGSSARPWWGLVAILLSPCCPSRSHSLDFRDVAVLLFPLHRCLYTDIKHLSAHCACCVHIGQAQHAPQRRRFACATLSHEHHFGSPPGSGETRCLKHFVPILMGFFAFFGNLGGILAEKGEISSVLSRLDSV